LIPEAAVKTAIINGKVVTPEGVRKGLEISITGGKLSLGNPGTPEFLIKNGRLVEENVSGGKTKADKIIDAKGSYVLPGFFDTHLHGGALIESSKGRYEAATGKFVYSEKEFEKGYPRMLLAHAQHGTTSMILSISSNPKPAVEMFMKTAGSLVNKKSLPGAKLLGLDMEGTYIKDQVYGGAQDPQSFIEPDIKYFEKLNRISGGNIKKALVAPEWGDPALKFIKFLVKNGIKAGVGHSGATYAEMMKAYDAGVTYAVHFGNGPMSQNFKAGGVLDAMLELSDKITIELIADLNHIHPKWLSAFLKAFNFNAVGITDAMFVAASPSKVKEFQYGPFAVEVRNGAAWLKEKKNTLCGSCVTMDIIFENLLNIIAKNQPGYISGKLFDKPVSLDSAVSMASRLVSENPAKLYGFEGRLGSIEDGKAADLVIAEIKEKNGKVKVGIKTVVVGGEIQR